MFVCVGLWVGGFMKVRHELVTKCQAVIPPACFEVSKPDINHHHLLRLSASHLLSAARASPPRFCPPKLTTFLKREMKFVKSSYQPSG